MEPELRLCSESYQKKKRNLLDKNKKQYLLIIFETTITKKMIQNPHKLKLKPRYFIGWFSICFLEDYF